MMRHVMKTYGRKSIAFTHGNGAWIYDTSGKRYLDALCGIAVTGLGHNHPKITKAIREQAGALIHCSNLYQIPEQEALATKLCSLSNMETVFFSNSGAEANEAAIKLARLFGHNKGIEAPVIIVAEQSFHGRTMATLSATGNRKVQAGFEPLLSGFARVPYGDVEAINQVALNNKNIVAIFVEPIQGEGGIQIPHPEYLNNLRTITDKQDWLLMVDEVQTGMGRTGAWFAHQHNGIAPDVMTLAKGLGNGVPIGACLARDKAAEILAPGTHGSTFGGNPLVSRASLATINAIESDSLIDRATFIGNAIAQGLRTNFSDEASIVEIRNKGLMIGIELDRPCVSIVDHALEAGLLLNVTADSVIRLLPPLILDDEQIKFLIVRLTTVINKFLEESK
ncbi:MAG: aspartate aminotransferase family protein [Proteobacteria bacterium]|nr:aspartate aminotransferase family protein [Pseudomonadota bacterium]MDA0861154.1 aspartate aminotransferase family protein [Pseudomonadota bacterium]MDA1030352.1 aspartate aminotransferase family protein [Pseudomonadota bacterium]